MATWDNFWHLMAIPNNTDTHTHTHTDGETLTSGELEGFIQQATTGSALHRLVPAGEEKQPWEQIRSAMAENSTFLEKFHNSLQDGDYDAEVSKTKVCVCVCVCAPFNIRGKYMLGLMLLSPIARLAL